MSKVKGVQAQPKVLCLASAEILDARSNFPSSSFYSIRSEFFLPLIGACAVKYSSEATPGLVKLLGRGPCLILARGKDNRPTVFYSRGSGEYVNR